MRIPVALFPLFPCQIGIWKCWFLCRDWGGGGGGGGWWGGRALGEESSAQGREPTTKSTHI